ncbi:MAG TPA: hypothetical protein PLV83_01130 [Bacilli bacterium]|nr:hypothetical protein [Bacilli bacterium]
MRKINNLLKVLLLIISIFFFIYNIVNKEIAYAFIALAILPLISIPSILRKMKVLLNDSMELIYIIFIVFALVLGSLFKFYDLIYFYDKLVHFTSGILSAVVGIYLLVIFKKYDKNNKVFNAIFIFFTSLAVASLWEMFEYTSSIVFKVDPQRVLTTGVNDTMLDIIMAALASILVIMMYLYEETNKKNLIIKRFINKLN